VGLVLCAAISYYVVERPAIAFGKRLIASSSAPGSLAHWHRESVLDFDQL
jgi:peptidoglycan/LPS O-acetylase OafA/YrhL